MTDKEIFERVKEHLLKQGRKSVGKYTDKTSNCMYRGPEGTKCAVGCLIADEHYRPSLEGRAVLEWNRTLVLPRSGGHLVQRHRSEGRVVSPRLVPGCRLFCSWHPGSLGGGT